MHALSHAPNKLDKFGKISEFPPPKWKIKNKARSSFSQNAKFP